MENKVEIEEIEKEKLSYQSIKMISGVLFILGLILGIYIYIDYIHRGDKDLTFHFNLNDNIPALADALLGTTGLCWSLAGTLLFFYTILQTRQEMNLQIKEMKQTNSSLMGQKHQTTFFNLLDNHTRLINNIKFYGNKGQDGLELFSNELFNGYKVYKYQYDKRVFLNPSFINRHPYNSLNDNKSSVESYISNFVTILKFIDEKLDDKVFYYQLLLNYLSLSERFLLGSYVNNFRNENQIYIEKHSFYFLHFYYSRYPEFRFERQEHFPRIFFETELSKSKNEEFVKEYLDKTFQFDISIDNSVFNEFVSLISCEIIVRNDFGEFGEFEESIYINNNPELKDFKYVINFDNEFYNKFSRIHEGEFYLEAKFIFKTTYDTFTVYWENLFQKIEDDFMIAIKINQPSFI